MKSRWCLFLLCTAAAYGQPPKDFGASVRAAMEVSLAKQRASVQKQAESITKIVVNPEDSSFFTLPFAAQSDPVAYQDAVPMDDVPDVLIGDTPRRESQPSGASTGGAERSMELVTSTVGQFDMHEAFDLKEDSGAGTLLLRLLGVFNATPSREDSEGDILRKLPRPDYSPAKIMEVDRRPAHRFR